MRIGLVPESPIEWLVTRLNMATRPVIETKFAYTQARLIMVATKIGVFETLANGPATSTEVAERCGTNPVGTEKLLFALAGAGYLRGKDGEYSLTPVSRKWLLRHSPRSLTDMMLFQFPQWDWLDRVEDYVRTGNPFDMHTTIDDDQWGVYQRAMRSLASSIANEAIRRMSVPKRPSEMLDIGGSHGFYSVALCRQHETLHATILDLPKAIEHAAPLLAAEGMGERIAHRPGDALLEDLGTGTYDIILMSQLVHHFSEAQNRDLVTRISRALRPGGVHIVVDQFRSPTVKNVGQIAALQEFFFAFTSQSGTWSVKEVADWQRRAGLKPSRSVRLRRTSGVGLQAAVKPS